MLELLVAIIILGILALVTVPSYLNHRKSALDASIRSDLRHMAEAQESWITDGGALRGTRNRQMLLEHGAAYSPGVVIEIARGSDRYCLRGHHPDGNANGTDGGGYFWYDSTGGGMPQSRSMIPPVDSFCASVNATDWEGMSPDPTVDQPPPVTAAPAPETAPIAAPPPPPPAPVESTAPIATTAPTGPVGDPSTQAPPPNNTCEGALDLRQPGNLGETVSPVVDNALATTDDFGIASLYFTHLTPTAAYETIQVRAPEGGDGSLPGLRTLTVVEGTCGQNATLLNTSVVGQTTSTYPGVSFRAKSNAMYYVVAAGALGKFQVAVERSDTAPRADDFSTAEIIAALPNQTVTQDLGYSTLFATAELAELPTGFSSVWHKVRTTSQPSLLNTPTYTFTTRAPTTGRRPIGEHIIEVYSTSVSAAVPGVLVATKTGTLPLSVTFPGAALNQDVMVRVRSDTGVISGDYSITLARGTW